MGKRCGRTHGEDGARLELETSGEKIESQTESWSGGNQLPKPKGGVTSGGRPGGYIGGHVDSDHTGEKSDW